MSEENNDSYKNKRVEELKSKPSKKQLRFQIATKSAESSESFNSAQSSPQQEEEEEINRPGTSGTSFLRNFVQLPLKDIGKLTYYNPCFSKDGSKPEIEPALEEIKKAAASPKSSQQLFEIAMSSPVPSDADLNLITSTYLRKLEGVREALRSGANVNSFRDNQTPLLICAETGEHRLVAYLLTVPNINPDIPNVFGETPLLIAVRNAFGKIIKLLLNHNADVNKADSMGRTPLQIALFQKRPRLAKLLLAYGADYEKEDCFGERPMYTSTVKRPHLECLLVLLRVGANPEYFNFSGMTLLSRTILNCSTFKIIRTLIRFGASVNSQDWYSKKTPLHFAAMINDVEVTKYLLTHGADAYKTTIYNFTPFDEAVFHKSVDVAEILLKYTKNPKMKALLALKPDLHKVNK